MRVFFKINNILKIQKIIIDIQYHLSFQYGAYE
jgi:hypothetical protein